MFDELRRYPAAGAETSGGKASTSSENLLVKIATDAYVYAYAMLLMEATRRVSTGLPSPTPMNEFGHARNFPDHTFREVVRPNVDTLYSFAWLDLEEEPILLTVPSGID
jgi:hypothetical protein